MRISQRVGGTSESPSPTLLNCLLFYSSVLAIFSCVSLPLANLHIASEVKTKARGVEMRRMRHSPEGWGHNIKSYPYSEQGELLVQWVWLVEFVS